MTINTSNIAKGSFDLEKAIRDAFVEVDDAFASLGIITGFDGTYSSLDGIPTSILEFNITDGLSGQVLKTDGAGNFFFADATVGSGTNTGDILFSNSEISSATDEDITVVTNENTFTFGTNGSLTFPDIAPASSVGVSGDKAGMMAVSGGYLYVCTADYSDGLSDIWTRTLLTTGTW